MIIRKATKKDLKECLEIQKPDKEWTLKNLKDAISNKRVIFLVAEDYKKIIGYVIGYIDPCMQEDILIHEVRVDKKMRQRGIGTELIDSFCKGCFKIGVKNISALIQPQHLKFYVDSCKFKRKGSWLAVEKRR